MYMDWVKNGRKWALTRQSAVASWCLSVCLSVTARQCSVRGGDLRLTVRGEDGRVDIAGRSVVVLNGTFNTSS